MKSIFLTDSPLKTRWLAGLTLICGSLAIASAPWALDWAPLLWVFKPLTTLLIIGYAVGRGRTSMRVRFWVLTGLVLSLFGDVALLWPDEGFLFGLISFMLAHLAYLWAFTRSSRFPGWWLAFGAYGVVATAVLVVLWHDVPNALQGPVVIYVMCLCAMAGQTASMWRQGMIRGGVLAFGGALFLLSDALLATDKFSGPLGGSDFWVLGTYWAAQWCIASWLSPDPHVPATLNV